MKQTLAEMGEVKNFPSHKKLIAFAGLDPSVHQSRKFMGASKLSMAPFPLKL